MYKKMLLGAIPTFVAGIAILTLAAPQQAGLPLNHVKMTVAKTASHSVSHASHRNTNKAARVNRGTQHSQATSADETMSYVYGPGFRVNRGWRSARGWRSNRDRRSTRGWQSWRANYFSYEGNDDEPELE